MKKVTREEEVEKKLKVHFRNLSLLHNALIHRSFLNESSERESNERFEFLGDAVLEFIVSSLIFESYPDLQEGELTALRSKLVNTQSLAAVAKSLGLGDALYISRGEEEGGGRVNPTLLADTFEAVLGALYLDQGTTVCEKVIKLFILPRTQTALENLKDSKSLLQEVIQAKGKRAPLYKVIKEQGPDHAKTFIVGVTVEGVEIAQGVGKSKQEAEQKAAQEALKKL